MLTVYPASELYTEIQNGNWVNFPQGIEKTKYFINTLSAKLRFSGKSREQISAFLLKVLGASNAVQLHGNLPSDRTELVTIIDEVSAECRTLRRLRCAAQLPES